MTISFLTGLLDTKAMASFSSAIGSVAFTMFWNMVLFLQEDKQMDQTYWTTHVHKYIPQNTPSSSSQCFVPVSNCGCSMLAHQQSECSISENLLDVKSEISGNDANVEQVLHMLKLALLEVAEDVQALQEAMKNGQNVCLTI